MNGHVEPSLHAGVLRIHLQLPANSLKEKRSIIRPIVTRLRHRVNASVVEAGDLDHTGTAVVAAVCLSNDIAYLQGQLQAVVNAVETAHADAIVADVETELISV